MRLTALVLCLFLLVAILLGGCARGGERYPEDVWTHIEHHAYVGYKGLDSIRKFLDRHLWNLDEEDPDSY